MSVPGRDWLSNPDIQLCGFQSQVLFVAYSRSRLIYFESSQTEVNTTNTSLQAKMFEAKFLNYIYTATFKISNEFAIIYSSQSVIGCMHSCIPMELNVLQSSPDVSHPHPQAVKTAHTS